MKRLTAKVLSCAPLNAEMGLLTLALPAGAEAAVPGQFAHLAVPGDRAHLLRRPISLYSVHDGILELGIAAKGEGTRRILAAKPGEEIDLLYPLGRGFEKGGLERIAFVGGGIGVAPLRFAMEAFADARCRAVFGFRSRDLLYAVEACERTGAPCLLYTSPSPRDA